VVTGQNGITITDDSDKQNQLRLVGGAILFSTKDPETQEQTWMTGITKDGISANLVTTGRLDTGSVQIMSGTEPVFRWDAYGISAYDTLWNDAGGVSTVSGVNSRKFVRFDKHGIYGINNYPGVDGAVWHPTNKTDETALEEIDKKATFALTWEGFKVTNRNGATLRIGDNAKLGGDNTNLMEIRDADGNVQVRVSENGSMFWSTDSSPTRVLYTHELIDPPSASYGEYNDNYSENDLETENIDERWHKIQSSQDWYASYSYDGGETWGEVVLI
jgi:hypothetical protein